MSLDITEVRIYTRTDDTRLKAYASVTISHCLVITGLKIFSGTNGMFVAMPSQHNGDTWKDIVYPVTKEAKEALTETVLTAYHKQTGQQHPQYPQHQQHPQQQVRPPIPYT